MLRPATGPPERTRHSISRRGSRKGGAALEDRGRRALNSWRGFSTGFVKQMHWPSTARTRKAKTELVRGRKEGRPLGGPFAFVPAYYRSWSRSAAERPPVTIAC